MVSVVATLAKKAVRAFGEAFLKEQVYSNRYWNPASNSSSSSLVKLPEALVPAHTRLLPHAARAQLDTDLVSVEVVAVELFEDLVDLVPSGVRVDVHKTKVLDDVGLDHGDEAVEDGAEFVVGRPFLDIA